MKWRHDLFLGAGGLRLRLGGDRLRGGLAAARCTTTATAARMHRCTTTSVMSDETLHGSAGHPAGEEVTINYGGEPHLKKSTVGFGVQGNREGPGARPACRRIRRACVVFLARFCPPEENPSRRTLYLKRGVSKRRTTRRMPPQQPGGDCKASCGMFPRVLGTWFPKAERRPPWFCHSSSLKRFPAARGLCCFFGRLTPVDVETLGLSKQHCAGKDGVRRANEPCGPLHAVAITPSQIRLRLLVPPRDLRVTRPCFPFWCKEDRLGTSGRDRGCPARESRSDGLRLSHCQDHLKCRRTVSPATPSLRSAGRPLLHRRRHHARKQLRQPRTDRLQEPKAAGPFSSPDTPGMREPLPRQNRLGTLPPRRAVGNRKSSPAPPRATGSYRPARDALQSSSSEEVRPDPPPRSTSRRIPPPHHAKLEQARARHRLARDDPRRRRATAPHPRSRFATKSSPAGWSSRRTRSTSGYQLDPMAISRAPETPRSTPTRGTSLGLHPATQRRSRRKLKWAQEWGADTVVDLSTRRQPRRNAARRSSATANVPIGTVPIYSMIIGQEALRPRPRHDHWNRCKHQAQQGVDYFTIHAGVHSASTCLSSQHRLIGIVSSRGSAARQVDDRTTASRRPMSALWEDIRDIMREYDVAFLDRRRPPSRRTRRTRPTRAQLAELSTLGELTEQALAEGCTGRDRRTGARPVRPDRIQHEAPADPLPRGPVLRPRGRSSPTSSPVTTTSRAASERPPPASTAAPHALLRDPQGAPRPAEEGRRQAGLHRLQDRRPRRRRRPRHPRAPATGTTS